MKTDNIPSLDNVSQSNTSAQIVHIKQDLVTLFPDCFQCLGKFQGEPYSIKGTQSVPPKKTPCWSVPFHQQGAIGRSTGSRHHQAS